MKIKKISMFAVLILTTFMASAQQFAGDWKGAISVQGIQLELIFHITENNGTYEAKLDVPM